MNQFLIFRNASDGTTALPLETVSRLELELILQAGVQLVKAHSLTVEVLYPRGTSFHYNALTIVSPNGPALVPSMAES